MKINEVHQLLKSAYVDWSQFLANPNYIRSSTVAGPCITWANRTSGIIKHPVLASHVSKLFREGQFTFQIAEDGSLIQIYYQYNRKGDTLTSARLAFYSTRSDEGKRIASSIQPERSMEKVSGLPITSDTIDTKNKPDIPSDIDLTSSHDAPVSWLRIEYEPTAARGILHYDCHMHLSSFPHSRFIVAGIPSPAQFIEFIAAFCYPESYKKHRLDELGQYISSEKIDAVNATCFPLIYSSLFNQIAHFCIPINT
jgi:hypothetical protein